MPVGLPCARVHVEARRAFPHFASLRSTEGLGHLPPLQRPKPADQVLEYLAPQTPTPLRRFFPLLRHQTKHKLSCKKRVWTG